MGRCAQLSLAAGKQQIVYRSRGELQLWDSISPNYDSRPYNGKPKDGLPSRTHPNSAECLGQGDCFTSLSGEKLLVDEQAPACTLKQARRAATRSGFVERLTCPERELDALV